jgi:exodeoxyribonuclease V beta subunit
VTAPLDARPFDVCGPLPSGVTVLEASAGTGKTYTIAALAARYVADGVPLEQLLLVTFTRMATGELRDRVRERLVATEQALDAVLMGAPLEDRDEVVRLLATGAPDQVRLRRDRLGQALADFDAATIVTTHGFCQEVLGGLGVAGDVERDGVFVEDVGDLVEEVVDDLYVRRFRGSPAQFGREEAAAIARIAIENPAAPVEPHDAPDTTVASMRRRLALKARAELEARKRRAGLMTYDDLLTRLQATLAGPGGEAVAARLRARYRVVLVDEFQDTDPVQWDIMRRAFGAGGGTLVLIGDPKQAIYAFRGADVYAYLEAAAAADDRATLGTNWRSDQGLLTPTTPSSPARAGARGDRAPPGGGGGRQPHAAAARRAEHRAAARAGGAPRRAVDLDHEQGLRGRRVGARAHRPGPGGRARGAAVLPGGDRGPRRGRDPARAHARVPRARRRARAHAPHGGARPRRARRRRDPGRHQRRGQRLRHGSRARLAAAARGARAAHVGAARAGRRAHAVPGLDGRAGRAADEDAWEDVHRRLHHWARILRVRGVATLAETITLVEGLPARVLARADGERRLTDLRHVAQLLHAAATADRLGVTALTGWLRRRIAAAEQETGDEERSRRLESDAQAVQVLTIHRSKGLEFPIVCLPFLWEPGWIPRDVVPVAYHDPAAGDRRTIDVALDGVAFEAHRRQHRAEQRGEDLRLAYVALTRAQHQAIVWWAGSWDSRDSALGRLLFARGQDGTVPESGLSVPEDDAAVARFTELAAAAPGCVTVERSSVTAAGRWSPAPRATSELAAGTFDRRLDRQWRRTSYSDITAGTYEARVASEPEEDVVDDEQPADGPAVPAPGAGASGEDAALEADLRARPSLLAGMPVGVHVGTFVHRVLEAADFAADDLDEELARCVASERARRAVDVGEPAAVVAGLRAAIETPLGPVLGGDARLRDLARVDRLDELDFELPLVGGDAPRARLSLDAIAGVLRAHLPAGDPLSGYAERLADPGLRPSLRGYLTGSIDLVARVRDPAGVARFAVVDYKTNWLGAPGEELSLWHHRPAALAAEMHRAHYALQALLYTAALHRFLRWRVAGYDPEVHLAGVVYLFLRGMTGADTPQVDGSPCGVFSWRPPGALVTALSDVLDRGGAA